MEFTELTKKLIYINFSFICRILLNKFTKNTKCVEKVTEVYLLR